MDNALSLPTDLQSVIGAEKVYFSVYAKRKEPRGKSSFVIVFGTVWTAFISIFVVAFFGPLLKGKEVHFKSDGVPVTASWDNFEPLIGVSLGLGVFLLVGLGMLTWGFRSYFQKGGYFVGAESRLINFCDGSITSYDWEQFSGNIEINNAKGDISMQLRTGTMVSRRNESAAFVPDVVYISGAANILEIEKICRKKIKENDPTPANNYNIE